MSSRGSPGLAGTTEGPQPRCQHKLPPGAALHPFFLLFPSPDPPLFSALASPDLHFFLSSRDPDSVGRRELAPSEAEGDLNRQFLALPLLPTPSLAPPQLSSRVPTWSGRGTCFFLAFAGRVARAPSEVRSGWVAHTSGLRVGLLVSLFPGFHPPTGSIGTNPASPFA